MATIPFLCGRFRFDLDRPLIMGIVNVTPDSFSDGGRHPDPARAIEHALSLVEDGADIVDIGGESTRPGAEPVALQVELDRVLPVVTALRGLGVAISVDTGKPQAMTAALAGGADMINDVNAFRAAGAIEAVAGSDCGLCVMHMRGEPRSMQAAPEYGDVVGEVASFLSARAHALERAGVASGRIAVDPGFGFGKTLAHNIALMRGIGAISALGYPLLAGVSRKSMIGAVTGRPVDERMAGSVAAALIAVQNGASIVRVHDVAQTRDALKVWEALRQEGDAG
jgi:dihydropteroate synthase